jgi:hypothetical protein
MMEYKPDRVALSQVKTTVISTIKIPIGLSPYVYETCLFYNGEKSEVVDSYQTETDALRGHVKWVNKLLEDER